MKPAKELYPQCQKEVGEYFSSPNDYTPIINELGNVVLRSDDDDYHGNTFVLLYKNIFGYVFVQIGWGSCSGCDALQACESYTDVDALAKSIEESAVALG